MKSLSRYFLFEERKIAGLPPGRVENFRAPGQGHTSVVNCVISFNALSKTDDWERSHPERSDCERSRFERLDHIFGEVQSK
jgi:hypothetical protein